ncbi:hypothetical protein RHGRI_000209 [Rhododendron griersonianum]|uniref:Uncharacterized protein n=1 Tax=Rhododendron griersonianum TaxID=479676 RepID=A0AAV6LIZ5_9ERIC|nr:hypothetical protein RHGRI_000209 [Rhododendron griersonianum]
MKNLPSDDDDLCRSRNNWAYLRRSQRRRRRRSRRRNTDAVGDALAITRAVQLDQNTHTLSLSTIVVPQASFLHTAVQESFRDPAYKQILFHLFSKVLNSQTRLSKDLLPLFTYLIHSGINEAGLEDEERRPEALVLVGCSGNCSNPEVVEALCSVVKSIRFVIA